MKYLKAFIGVIILTALDQWSKYMVLIHVKPVGSIPLIKNILSFTYHENRGAVWGIMQGQIPVLILTTLVILIGVLWIYIRIPENIYGFIWCPYSLFQEPSVILSTGLSVIMLLILSTLNQLIFQFSMWRICML